MVKRVTIELISEAVGEAFRRLLGNPIALALFIALVAWLSYYARRRRARYLSITQLFCPLTSFLGPGFAGPY